MPLDDLWALHERLTALLSKRILAEKRQLENRLVQLNRGKVVQASAAAEVKSATPGYKIPGDLMRWLSQNIKIRQSRRRPGLDVASSRDGLFPL